MVFVDLGGVQPLHLICCSAHLSWLEAQSNYQQMMTWLV